MELYNNICETLCRRLDYKNILLHSLYRPMLTLGKVDIHAYEILLVAASRKSMHH